MLNLHPLECTIKDNDHIPDLLLANYWVITCCVSGNIPALPYKEMVTERRWISILLLSI